MSKKRGRPTKYDPKYCREIIAYFKSAPKTKLWVKSEKIITKSNGTTETFKEYGILPGDLPTIEKFAMSIKVDDDTLERWADKFKGFCGAYNKAKKLEKQFLVDNGLGGLYPPASFIFVAKNVTELKDMKAVDHTTGGEKIKGIILTEGEDDSTDSASGESKA